MYVLVGRTIKKKTLHTGCKVSSPNIACRPLASVFLKFTYEDIKLSRRTEEEYFWGFQLCLVDLKLLNSTYTWTSGVELLVHIMLISELMEHVPGFVLQ